METSEDQKPFLERYPTLQYLMLTALGTLGIWISMPIVYPPQSTVEWVDLVINLLIFVPCSLVAVGGALLTTASAVFSFQPDSNGRFVKLATGILSAFGLRSFLQPELGMFAPLGLLTRIFLDEASEEEDPEEIAQSSADGDPESPRD